MKTNISFLKSISALVRFPATGLKKNIFGFKTPVFLKNPIPAKIELVIEMVLTALILICLGLFNFYGMYTDSFFFLKGEGWAFVGLAAIHVFYLSLILHKMRSYRSSDWGLRISEIVMYVVVAAYGYMLAQVIIELQNTELLTGYVIPDSFYTKSYCLIGLFIGLMLLTIRLFFNRKRAFGPFKSVSVKTDLDNWVPMQVERGLGTH